MTSDAPHPSFRLDPLTGNWAVIAPQRRATGAAPDPGAGPPPIAGRCPFCPGHEGDTEETVHAWPDEEAWRVRVFRNRYPAARPDARLEQPAGEWTAVAALGLHDVIIETPDHDVDLADLDDAHATEVVRVYRDRARELARGDGVRMVAAFRNRGRRAGASQPHPHGQVISGAAPSPEALRRMDAARAFSTRQSGRLVDHFVEREVAAGVRVVEETAEAVVLCPWAPWSTHQVWIVPRDSRGSFTGLADARIAPLAAVILRTLRRLRSVTVGADYNLLFRMPPVGMEDDAHAYWYVDLVPRRSGGAGLELSTGLSVITVPPEDSAAMLRSA